MSLVGEHVLLRIYLQSADRAPHTPTYERLVTAARRRGLAGATLLRGIMGLGASGIIPGPKWSLAEHVPVIVEMVDSAEKIYEFITAELDRQMTGGLATLERASVMMYRGAPPTSASVLQLGPELPPLSTLPPHQSRIAMKTNENGVLLRVFIGESDKFAGKPLYEAIVQKVRELGLAGATVLRGAEGFGANSVVHKARLLEMSIDLPIVIEIVDVRDKIDALLPHLEAMVQEGMITMEYVVILMYRHNEGDTPAAS